MFITFCKPSTISLTLYSYFCFVFVFVFILFLFPASGNWFTENLFWWSKRHDPNVFFVKYEDMQKVQY